MRIDIISIFPEYLAPLGVSLIGRARETGLLDVHVHDLRVWTTDVHRTVDDTPYGGGPGMVMKCEPWGSALDAVTGGETRDGHSRTGPPRLVVPTPSGRLFSQELAEELSGQEWLLFACGRYEGIDARVVEDARSRMVVDEVSIGDYVLAGGEAAVLVIVEAVARVLPGVLGNTGSISDDSFAPGRMAGLLEGPVYTKPAEWRGRMVPHVLISGHHAAIQRWRRDQALIRTAEHRPDLVSHLSPGDLDSADLAVLAALGWEVRGDQLVRAD